METFIEIETPTWPDSTEYESALARFKNVNGIIIAENGGVSAPVFAKKVARTCDEEIFLKISCRDRNRIALRSEFATCAELGLTKIVLLDGVHPIHTRYPTAKPVYDLDSLTLLKIIKRKFRDESSSLELGRGSWSVGVCVGGSTYADRERAKRFIDAGADVFFVRSLEAARFIREMTEKRVFVSVVEEDAPDLDTLLNDAESAGASGVNILMAAPGVT